MKTALISVSDKSGVVEFAKDLEWLGYQIISTGGTLSVLQQGGVGAKNVSDITGFSECLDGRVKTLHPVVHAGILAKRQDAQHMAQLKDLDISTIDIVAINLYPFKNTIQKPDVSFEEAVENIDIGGPTMLRSAAKNYQDVYAICDSADYKTVIDELKNGVDNIDTRLKLMYKVFQHTAVYDTLISGYLREKLNISFPNQLTLAYEKVQDMRYGENPNQQAAFYKESYDYPGSLVLAEQLLGKELSFNNINDTNGALDLLREFGTVPTAVAVKHANPCGVGTADNIYDAYVRAYQSDAVSIFGGIVALNYAVDARLATEMVKTFLEIVVAPSFTEEAVQIFEKNRKNIRLLRLPTINSPIKPNTWDMKKVVGGMLVQDYDNNLYDKSQLKVVTKKAPTAEQMQALEFGFKVVKHTKSNAIVVSNAQSTLGIGMGQTNRIWAAELALSHAGNRANGAIMASDAFFPFPDCILEAKKYGISAIIQPGGSVNDQLSIDACDELGIAMVFCGLRHFKH